MANFLRFLVGIALLPMCWGATRVFFRALVASADAGKWASVEMLSLLGGILAFALAWLALSHPVRAYVLGHELTHALWGMFFGARPSDLRVGESGGSVRLTKSNMLITLAPYFFPFYTFVVIVFALVTYAFVRPLPFLPMWLFLVGFTWAFHVLFTIETLGQRQPDVKPYGRVFSWTFIYIVNLALVLVWFASTTPFTFADLGRSLLGDVKAAYAAVASLLWSGCRWIVERCTQT